MTASEKVGPVVAPLDARVMTGCDETSAQPIGVLRERSEFDEVIARDARVGRSSRYVVAHETVDDRSTKSFLEIQHIMWNSQRRRAAAGVVKVTAAATALGGGRTRGRLHFHRDTDDVVAAFDQQACGNGGIHSPAHRCNYAFPCHLIAQHNIKHGT